MARLYCPVFGTEYKLPFHCTKQKPWLLSYPCLLTIPAWYSWFITFGIQNLRSWILFHWRNINRSQNLWFYDVRIQEKFFRKCSGKRNERFRFIIANLNRSFISLSLDVFGKFFPAPNHPSLFFLARVEAQKHEGPVHSSKWKYKALIIAAVKKLIRLTDYYALLSTKHGYPIYRLQNNSLQKKKGKKLHTNIMVELLSRLLIKGVSKLNPKYLHANPPAFL